MVRSPRHLLSSAISAKVCGRRLVYMSCILVPQERMRRSSSSARSGPAAFNKYIFLSNHESLVVDPFCPKDMQSRWRSARISDKSPWSPQIAWRWNSRRYSRCNPYIVESIFSSLSAAEIDLFGSFLLSVVVIFEISKNNSSSHYL